MNQQEVDVLSKRLDRLELEGRWWRMFGIIGVAILGLVVLMGAKNNDVKDEIRARKFYLFDDAGRRRAVLTNFEGSPIFNLSDKKENTRISIGLLPNGKPGFVLLDDDGKGRGGFFLHQDGTPSLEFLDGNETIRSVLGMKPNGSPSMNFYDETGDLRTVLAAETDTLTGLLIRKGKEVLVTLGVVSSDNLPFVTLYNKDNVASVSLDVNVNGSPSLRLKDNSGAIAVLGHSEIETTRTGVVEQRPASSLVLFNKDGKVIWSAP